MATSTAEALMLPIVRRPNLPYQGQKIVHVRVALGLCAVVNSLLGSGCMVVGLGVGAGMPRYSAADPRSLDMIAPGAEVRVEVGMRAFEGEYAGLELGTLNLRKPGGAIQALRFEGIQAIGVKDGNYAGEGFLVGLAVDVAVAAGFFWAMSNTR